MPIKGLSFTNVGPFDEVEFEFDPQVNVFTGPNNSGKSSALWVLGDIAVYPFSFPDKLLRPETSTTFKLQLSDSPDSGFSGQLPMRIPIPPEMQRPGGRHRAPKRWAEHINALKAIGYSKFIPALRRSTDFRSRGPTVNERGEGDRGNAPYPDDLDVLFRRFDRTPMQARRRRIREGMQDPELRRRLALVSENASLVSDEEVIQEIIDLDYRAYVRNEAQFRDIIVKIGAIASEITEGFSMKFSGVGEDANGFFPQFKTVDGLMPLNTLSQGTQSVVQWLAHLLIGYAEYYDFPENLEDKPGVLIIDEIDAHLHPTWQRRIIPALTNHFPNLQIFCSTHSPLMLAGLKEGQVQLLQRDEKGKVTVSRNEVDITGWTADEILRNFLGVRDPTDLQAADRLRRLNDLERKETLSAEEEKEVQELRNNVSRDLRSGPRSVQVEEFAELLKQAKEQIATAAKPAAARRSSRPRKKPGE